VESAVSGDTMAYTLTVTNDGMADLPLVSFNATFPPGFIARPAPELTLVNNRLTWQGPLAKNQSRLFNYSAIVGDDVPLGTVAYQTTWLTYPYHKITVDRQAQVKVNFPDIRDSSFKVTPDRGVIVGTVLSYTIILKNSSLVNIPIVTVSNTLPPELEALSLDMPKLGAVITTTRSITWTVPLARNGVVALSYQAVVVASNSQIKNSIKIDDGVDEAMVFTAQAFFKYQIAYLPMIMRD